jgi:hypothetical protein
MIKFNWYTFKEKDEYGRYVGNIVYGVGGIAPFRKCYEHYRPNMKGGHTHNHIYNKCNKHLFRGRSRRKIDRKDKPEFVRTFHINVKLGNVTMDSLMHTIFYHNKKEK